MAIAACPKCHQEFTAADAIDQPQTCPACGERFMFLPVPAQTDAGRHPGNIAIAAWVTATIGWLIDAALATGAVSYLVELAALAARAAPMRVDSSAIRHAGSADPSGWAHAMVAACVLFAGLAGHAALSAIALAYVSSRPRRFLVLTRLAALCWPVIGGPAVFMGAHLWPIWLSGPVMGLLHGSLLVVIGLAFLAVLMMYLGGLEVCSQRIDKEKSG
jgi:DNA-directed RNA polymerase subunit RPC12/RpoP